MSQNGLKFNKQINIKMKQKESATPAATGVKNDLISRVLSRVNELKEMGGINLPENYSAANALQAAWNKLNELPERGGEPLIKKCTSSSVSNVLFEMVTAGLNPMKHQCSFIPRGQILTLQREYQGTIALARRFGGLKYVTSSVVYEGDKFALEVDLDTGKKKIKVHETSIESMDGGIKGAYAIVELEDGSRFCEVMTMSQIRSAWNQGAMKGKSPAHLNFPDQMSMKTVINRACKGLINSSDDGALFSDDSPIDYVAHSVQEELTESANKGEVINIDKTDTDKTDTDKPLNMDNEQEAEYVEAELFEDNPGF